MFASSVGIRVFGLAAVALGLEGLVWGDFAVVWQPLLPEGVAGHAFLARGVAVVALLTGLSLLWHRTAGFGAGMLTALYGFAVVFLDVPRVVAQPAVFLNWYGVAEPLALVAGGLAACTRDAALTPAAAARLLRISQSIFGACLIVFGLAHFVYFDYTASLVPAWLPPDQAFWTSVTAAAHGAAGIALLAGVYARPATLLLTAMFVVFGVLVHAPTLFIGPHTHANWAENAINLALVGAAWVVATALRDDAERPRAEPPYSYTPTADAPD